MKDSAIIRSFDSFLRSQYHVSAAGMHMDGDDVLNWAGHAKSANDVEEAVTEFAQYRGLSDTPALAA